MQGIIHFETFLLTGILLNITPGNDTVFILSRSIALGKKAGILSVLGIATGSICHTMFATFGLSVIIAASATVFNIIKYAGAAYLVYLGIRMFIDKASLDFYSTETTGNINLIKIYRDAFFTNLLNPKVAMFFIAFLPQFIDPAYRHSMFPFLVLGITFTVSGTIWCSLLAVFSATVFSRLRSNNLFRSGLNKACGAVLVGLGIKVAMTGRT